MADVLGPLPHVWDAKWKEIVEAAKAAKTAERRNRPSDGFPIPPPFPIEDLVLPPLTETFEPRRRAIVEASRKDQRYSEAAECAKLDHEALSGLLAAMQGLFLYEPSIRMTLEQAASCFKWADYRRNDMD